MRWMRRGIRTYFASLEVRAEGSFGLVRLAQLLLRNSTFLFGLGLGLAKEEGGEDEGRREDEEGERRRRGE